MKKRILALLLSAALFAALLPVPALAAEADEADAVLTTSEAGIALIKRFEGFSARPVADGSQWSIGYGNACSPGDYPNGITEEQADALLREALVYFEESLNRYLDAYGIVLNQAQFDALVSVTYNLGVAWINSSYRFWTILRSGTENYTENEIASALGVWCHVGTSVSPSLLQRRIQEIQIFLYGDYEGTESPSFTYLILDSCGGEVDSDVMLYRQGGPYQTFGEVTREGYYFAGWYTEKEGGERVLPWDIAESGRTLYARWSLTPVADPVKPTDPVAPGQVSAFPDVKSTDWFCRYVTELTQAGIIHGYSDGLYHPGDDVTTGQALLLILRAAGYPAQAPVSSHWASGYRSFALRQHFVFDGELDDLDAPITREMMAKLAAKALGAGAGNLVSVFADTDSSYVMALYHLGILSGSVDAAGVRYYRPESTTSRAEIARVVWAIYQLQG